MTCSSKKRRVSLSKPCATNGTFIPKTQNEINFKEEIGKTADFLGDWGNDDDSEWEEDLMSAETNYKRLLNLELVWKKDAYLEKKIRGPYLTGLTKKSTFYDNYGPNGKWTKAAEGTSKLTSFFRIESDIEEIPIDDDEWNFKEIEVKIENLKEELKSNQCKMSVVEYNKKRAIFEMLK